MTDVIATAYRLGILLGFGGGFAFCALLALLAWVTARNIGRDPR